jgi:hypothetical protein
MEHDVSDEHDKVPCAELRSKKWHFLKAAARSASDLLDASNSTWCARTAARIGPDGEPVDPDDCTRGRGCFVVPAHRALLES